VLEGDILISDYYGYSCQISQSALQRTHFVRSCGLSLSAYLRKCAADNCPLSWSSNLSLVPFSPLVFFSLSYKLLYTEDLPTDEETTAGTFADDTVILATHADPAKATRNLQYHLNLIQALLGVSGAAARWAVSQEGLSSVNK
jgi:hypothetical protein